MSAPIPATSDCCDCCVGVDPDTPRRITNPPGLPAIAYRIGRYGDFLTTMRSRLSSADHPTLTDGLRTRESSDVGLALIDALACSLDVLTFYGERYAQEHYLRTATERTSVLEMARLLGYRPAPGVAAGTYLAFTLQSVPGAPTEPITIPVGTRVQSVPGQDEQAQTFETIAATPARADWNALPAETMRAWRPQFGDTEVWLAGLTTHLQPGDAILIVGAERISDSGSEHWDVRVLASVEPDNDNNRTRVRWTHPLGSHFPSMSPAGIGARVYALRQRTALFGHNAPDPRLFGTANPSVTAMIDPHDASRWDKYRIEPPTIDLAVDNPKIVAGGWLVLVSNEAGFGSADLPGYTELYRVSRVFHRSRTGFGLSGRITRITPDTSENLDPSRYMLDRALVLTQSEALTAVDKPLFHPVYGDTLTLGQRVDGLRPGQPIALSGARQRIAVASAKLSLDLDGGDPIALALDDELFMTAPATRASGDVQEVLDPEGFTAQLGKSDTHLRLAVMDRDGRTGTLVVNASEVRLARRKKDDPTVREVVLIGTSDQALSHDRDHTKITLQGPLQHVFDRASLRINANVAPAGHGETVETILGDGDAGTANQRFQLNQTPLTYVSANTPDGRASTLVVRINDVQWFEVPTLYNAMPDARRFVTAQDDLGVTTIQFGDGLEGARVPSGQSNVRVRYRKGSGTAGNLAAGKLTTLLSRPLGVSEVVNPVEATGGEDMETLARVRSNAPLTVLALERAVSIADYANYARAFAGIDKALALWIPAGPARGVFLTVAGVDGAQVPETSATHRNVHDSLTTFGDPLTPLRVVSYTDTRFRCRLAVKVMAEFATKPVLAAIEAALRGHFGFARRDFGQSVSVDEVASVAQGVRGVAAVHTTRLYRHGEPASLVPRLFARVPVAALDTVPPPAELLTLAAAPIELEVLV